MTTPVSVPLISAPQQTAPSVTPEVIATANRVVRAKSFLKSTFKNVGTPAIAGASGALVVIVAACRANRVSEDDNVPSDTTVTVE